MPSDSPLTLPLVQPQRPSAPLRSAYAAFVPITTRWADNDVYGHVNNVVYYSWFDTAVNSYLIGHGALDMAQGSTIGLVVETQCHYFAPVSFPQAVTVGMRVAHRGSSSVRYELAVFAGDAQLACASGHFVHVYVDKATRRPVPLPDNLTSVLETLT
jgi:acyl-CoA thioester hydrolase